MNTQIRLNMFREFAYRKTCKGRLLKTPAPDMNFTVIAPKVEPAVYVAYTPMRAEENGWIEIDPAYTAPCMVIMQDNGYAKNKEEMRFDRYNGVHRPKEMGQQLVLNVLLCVYEDGLRLPGFVDKAEQNAKQGYKEGYDLSLVREGTEEGFFTLTNWMDDLKKELLGAHCIPNTDLVLDERNFLYGPYQDSKQIVDKRPLYYGFMYIPFYCYADEADNPAINALLI